jgi:hypothetical protein
MPFFIQEAFSSKVIIAVMGATLRVISMLEKFSVVMVFLFCSITGFALPVQDVRVFDASGLFRAHRVIVEGHQGGSKVKVEAIVSKLPAEGLLLVPLDVVLSPVMATLVGDKDGRLIMHFDNVEAGSWKINVASKELLEIRILSPRIMRPE